jgi:hypothetical protein
MKSDSLQVNEWNLENISLSEVSQVQKVKSGLFSLIYEI